MKQFQITLATTLLTTLALTGCGSTASNYQPLVDGTPNANYTADLADCAALAEKREYLNDDVKSEALLGAGLGAVVGILEDGSEGAIAGALVGGATGAGSRAWEVRDEQKQIVIQCMRGRGHKVVG